MKVAYYVNDLSQERFVLDMLREAVDSQVIEDGLIFYNNQSPNPPNSDRFATFNSTDVWHFTGTLICTSVSNLMKSSTIVNNFETVYLFTQKEKHVFNLLRALNVATVTVAHTEEDAKYIKRVTGQTVPVVGNSINNILEALNASRQNN